MYWAMRRLTWAALAAAALTLWIDALLWWRGDAGPVGWTLDMAIPQLFVLPCGGVALWALRRRVWPTAVGCMVVAVGQAFGPMGLCLGRPGTGPADLRVASYNVEKFEASMETVAAAIRRLDADVLCLQEAGVDATGFPMPERFRTLLPGYRFYAASGMAILSKRPFRKAETRPFRTPMGPAGWTLQSVMIDVGGRETLVCNVHLMPSSYQLHPTWPQLRPLERVESARRYRDEETDWVLSAARKADGPVVVCGDFNQQPYGPRYRRLASMLTDAFRATSTGFGPSLTSTAPTKRVDYVWTRGWKPLRTRVVPLQASDHMPVVADLALPTDASAERGG